MINKDEMSNYSTYSVEQLNEALSNTDKETYPETVHAIQAELSRRKNQQEHDATVLAARKAKVAFHGSGKEYFSIWIVNLLFTILTLGIYSAWATVRNNRYFYSNTEVDGHRFSYLAEPIQVLVGRIIGVSLFATYFLAASFSPAAAMVVMLVLFALIPVLVCLGASFRMRMTAYRNIRFNFQKDYGRAYLVFVVYTLIGMFSAGLLYPWALHKIDEFMHSRVTYGDKKLIPKLAVGEYYKASILAFLAALAIAFLGFLAMSVGDLATFDENGQAGPMTMMAMFLTYALMIVVSSTIYHARIRNHVYNNSTFTDVASFTSSVKISDLFILRITNLIMLIVSLGFLMPWIKVRTLKFYANATEVNIEAGADKVLPDQTQTGNAVGEEVASAFDIDVAIG